MYQVKFVVSVLFLISYVYADSAVQTDWSGGYGILGPVPDWGNEFYQTSCINWSDYPSSLLLSQGIREYTIEGIFDGASSVYSEDIDGDGYMDVLGTSNYGDDITWWKNSDTAPGIYWVKYIIDKDFDGAASVYSEDIDGDGDMDILGAATEDCAITWWENIDGSGTSWNEHDIAVYFIHVVSIYSEDIDGDGDMDVLGASIDEDDIAWWENIDGSGTSWNMNIVEGDYYFASSVYSEDINNDGDMDILGASLGLNEITWWENADTGAGIYWIEHVVSNQFNDAESVYSEDIDGDGDMDILGAASEDDDITWWENIDGSGTSWAQHTINGNFDGAANVYSEDIDSDGDMDVLGAGFYCKSVTWWENIDGSGTSWTEHIVDEDFNGARFVFSEDINNDGSMDILGAAYLDDVITWWDLNGYSPVGTLESSIFEIGWPVGHSIEWGAISWLGTEPSSTELAFLVRASGDPDNMGSWSDTITVSGTSLAGLLGEYDGYLQYMTILDTGDSDTTSILDEITIDWGMVGIDDTNEPIPPGTELLPIIPNPVKGIPVIRFGLPEPASVKISIFDLSGRSISEIHGDEYFPGYHDVLLGDLPPGIYFCRMISDDFTATQRFVVIE